MKININKVINDLGHASINGFILAKNINKGEKIDSINIYINKINSGIYIEAIVTFPGLDSKMINNKPKIFVELAIIINEEKIKYTRVLKIDYLSGFNNKLQELDGFREYYSNFRNNIRLFNGED